MHLLVSSMVTAEEEVDEEVEGGLKCAYHLVDGRVLR